MSVDVRMTEADHALVTPAVGRAESATNGEIVTITAEASDHYADIPLLWAALVTLFVGSTTVLFPAFYMGILHGLSGGWEHDYTPAELTGLLMGLLFLVFVGAWALVAHTSLRFKLASKATMTRRARERGILLFKVGAERRTRGLTGVLIFVSMAEHHAEIIADEAIVSKVAPSVWGDAMAALIAEIKQGRPGAGMAAAVEQVGKVLAEHFPVTGDNPNELPDRLIEL